MKKSGNLKNFFAGKNYYYNDPELHKLGDEAKTILVEYNFLPPAKAKRKKELLEKLTKAKLKNVVLTAPFYCDYGFNIEFGENIFVNANCVFLDCNKIKIGNNVLVAPAVQIYTVGHPLDYEERNTALEISKPVSIGDNCWIGGGAIILPGVTIGDGCVIGAGSVVGKDIPANSLAVGNPCKIIRQLNKK